MSNFFKDLEALIDPGRVQIGEVSAYENGVATLTLPGGGQMRARGQASVGSKVFVMDGVIQGPAPNLPVVVDVI